MSKDFVGVAEFLAEAEGVDDGNGGTDAAEEDVDEGCNILEKVGLEIDHAANDDGSQGGENGVDESFDLRILHEGAPFIFGEYCGKIGRY